MRVAAIDISSSINLNVGYGEKVSNVLKNIKLPFQIIRWHVDANIQICYDYILHLDQFKGYGLSSKPQCFIKLLPEENPIDLYIFTDGAVNQFSIAESKQILKEKKLQISSIKIYYIGNIEFMNFSLIHIFERYPREIYINDKFIGTLKFYLYLDDNDDYTLQENYLKLVSVDYDYIMQDNSFKLDILSKLNSGMDKAKLKKQLAMLMQRILIEYFNNKLSLKNICRDNDELISSEKNRFLKRMLDIVDLCDANSHSLKSLVDEKAFSLKNITRYTKTVCFSMKKFTNLRFIKSNPFQLLEIIEYIRVFVSLIECDTRINVKAVNANSLKDIYILSNDSIDLKSLIKHNNKVLSNFWGRSLKGDPVIWHMIFLYILATEKFHDMKSRLFEEITLLGSHFKYFVTLTPKVNPSIKLSLNTCLWYIANICHKAFPNCEKNILRSADYNSGVILKFYRDIYDKSYENPEEMPVWRLWTMLCNENKLVIFNILSYFFYYEKYTNVSSGFCIVLYNKQHSNQMLKLPKQYKFLSELNLETVLNVYKQFIHKKGGEFKINFNSETKEVLLDHVKIDIQTCLPLPICPVTEKHWKDCAGEYDKKKCSYLMLFRRYCKKYSKYPESSKHLLVFLNEYIFKKQKGVPELFSPSVEKHMDKVLFIFKEVMETYSCSEYLDRVKNAEVSPKSSNLNFLRCNLL